MNTILKGILLFAYSRDEAEKNLELERIFRAVQKSLLYIYKIDFEIAGKIDEKRRCDAVVFVSFDEKEKIPEAVECEVLRIDYNKRSASRSAYGFFDMEELPLLIVDIVKEHIKPVDKVSFDIEKMLQENAFPSSDEKTYVSRKKLENDVLQAIKDSDVVSIVSLLGYGGVGKTRLVQHILTKLQKRYRIIWIEILNETDFEDIAYNTILRYVTEVNGKQANLDDQKIVNEMYRLLRYIVKALKKKFSDTLLFVIDSAERNEAATHQLLAYLKGFKLLITSRKQVTDLGKTVKLSGMKPSEAFQLYRKRREQEKLSEDKKARLNTYFKQVDYLPLGIELIASIEYEKLSQFDTIFYLKETRQKLKSIFVTVYNQLGGNEQILLRIVAFLSSIKINEIEHILKQFKNKGNNNGYSENSLINSLEKLKEFFLLKEKDGLYSLHPLIREFAIELIESSESLNSVSVYRKLVEFYEDKPELREFIERTIEDFDDFTKNYLTYPENDREIYKEITGKIGDRLFYLGYFDMLEMVYRNIKNFSELADIMARRGKEEKAIEYFWKYLENKGLNEILADKKDSFMLYLFLHSVFDVALKKIDTKGALELIEKIAGFSVSALNYLYERYARTQDKDYLFRYDNLTNLLGVIYFMMDEDDTAQKLFKTTIYLTTRMNNLYNIANAINLYGESTIYTYNNLTLYEIYQNLQKIFDKLEKLFSKHPEIGEDKLNNARYNLLLSELLCYFENKHFDEGKFNKLLTEYKETERKVTIRRDNSEFLDLLYKLIRAHKSKKANKDNSDESKDYYIDYSDELKTSRPYFCALLDAFGKKRVAYSCNVSSLFSKSNRLNEIRGEFVTALANNNRQSMEIAIEYLKDLGIRPIYEEIFYARKYGERIELHNSKGSGAITENIPESAKNSSESNRIKICDSLIPIEKDALKELFKNTKVTKHVAVNELVKILKDTFHLDCEEGEEMAYPYPLFLQPIGENDKEEDLLKVNPIEATLLYDCFKESRTGKKDDGMLTIIAKSRLLKNDTCKNNFYNHIASLPGNKQKEILNRLEKGEEEYIKSDSQERNQSDRLFLLRTVESKFLRNETDDILYRPRVKCDKETLLRIYLDYKEIR